MLKFNRGGCHCRRLETAAPWPAAHHFFCGMMDPTKVARISIRFVETGFIPLYQGPPDDPSQMPA